VAWADILDCWSLLEADFQEYYGLDISGLLLTRRSLRWLEVRVIGLLIVRSRIRSALFPQKEVTPDVNDRR